MKTAIIPLMLILLAACMQTIPYKIAIGGAFHLTGPASFWGEGEKNGALLAVDDINAHNGINGKQLELIVEDSKTDFKGTATAINKLAEVDHLKVIIGPTWFGQVASPIANEKKILIISPSAGVVPQPSQYFFDLWTTERAEVIPEIDYMAKNGIQKVAIVYSLNDWSQSMRDNFVNEAKGLAIVKEFPTSPDETDFKTVISQIKELNVDAVYAPFAFYPSQGAFSKQSKELGLKIPLYSSSGTENPVLLEAYPSIEGTIYPYPAKGPGEMEFAKKYNERFGLPVSPSAAYAYDAVMLVAMALRDGKTTPDEISQYLHSIKDYAGVSNIITFDSNGRITQKEQVMKQIKDGKFEEVS